MNCYLIGWHITLADRSIDIFICKELIFKMTHAQWDKYFRRGKNDAFQ